MDMQALQYLEEDYDEHEPCDAWQLSTWKVDDRVGIITLPHFMHTGHLEQFMIEAMKAFHLAQVDAVVVDLRGNDGGHDGEPPQLLSFFADEQVLVENVAVPLATAAILAEAGENMKTCVDPAFMLWDNTAKATRPGVDEPHPSWVTPHADPLVRWHGPVAVLVNRCTLSNGDMSSMGLQRLGASIVGFEGTSGSVSLSDGKLLLPEIRVAFTMGQSLDEQMQIQLESGKQGKGGVFPDASGRIERSVENLHALHKWTLRQFTERGLETEAEDIEMTHAKKCVGIN